MICNANSLRTLEYLCWTFLCQHVGVKIVCIFCAFGGNELRRQSTNTPPCVAPTRTVHAQPSVEPKSGIPARHSCWACCYLRKQYHHRLAAKQGVDRRHTILVGDRRVSYKSHRAVGAPVTYIKEYIRLRGAHSVWDRLETHADIAKKVCPCANML